MSAAPARARNSAEAASFRRAAMSAEARLAALAVVALLGTGHVFAATPPAKIEHFAATTTAMTPRDAELRFDVREWSSDDARAAVVEALAADDAPKALAMLPTVGYVWPSTGAVGYSVKYAVKSADGSRITLVTDKRLGSYEYKGWSVDKPTATKELGYTVIELNVNNQGTGDGSLSLAADPKIDAQQKSVALGPDAPRVLTKVRVADDRN
jgi:hypothetical protein